MSHLWANSLNKHCELLWSRALAFTGAFLLYLYPIIIPNARLKSFQDHITCQTVPHLFRALWRHSAYSGWLSRNPEASCTPASTSHNAPQVLFAAPHSPHPKRPPECSRYTQLRALTRTPSYPYCQFHNWITPIQLHLPPAPTSLFPSPASSKNTYCPTYYMCWMFISFKSVFPTRRSAPWGQEFSFCFLSRTGLAYAGPQWTHMWWI